MLRGRKEGHERPTSTSAKTQTNGLWMSEMAPNNRDRVPWRNIAKASSVATDIDHDDADK